jgi:hypothetical protein
MAEIQIEGTAPLITNRFDEKARQMMADAQAGRKNVRQPKNIEACYEGSLYRLPGDRYGFPATGFKAAIVDASRFFDKSVTSVGLRQMIYVQGESSDMLVPIDGTPKMRTDTVRNATGVADIRYRAEFWPWRATLRVVFIKTMCDLGSLIALVDAAGIGGVGEWRPASKQSKTGMYGTFQVVDEQNARVVDL